MGWEKPSIVVYYYNICSMLYWYDNNESQKEKQQYCLAVYGVLTQVGFIAYVNGQYHLIPSHHIMLREKITFHSNIWVCVLSFPMSLMGSERAYELPVLPYTTPL